MATTLKTLAIVQAIAIAVLAVLWLQSPTSAPAAAPQRAGERNESPAPEQTHATDGDPLPPKPSGAFVAPSPASSTTAILYGSVRGETEAGDGVFLSLMQGSKPFGSLRASPTFAFPDLEPGRYELKGSSPGCLSLEQTVDVVAPHTRITVTFEKAWNLLVHAVTPDDKPLVESVGISAFQLRGLRAMAFRTPLTADLPVTEWGNERGGVGTYASNSPFERMNRNGPPPPKTAIGTLTLPLGSPLHVALVLRSTLLGSQPASPGQTEVKFVLRPEDFTARLASVRLRTVDGRDGKPLAKVRVSLSDMSSSGGGNETDTEGRIAIANVIPGILRLDGWHKDYALPPLLVDVRAGAQLDLGDVPLLPPDKVKLAVDGANKDGLSIYVQMLDPPAVPDTSATNRSHGSPSNPSDETVYSFYPGRYALVARDADHYARVEFDTRTATETVRVQLRPSPRLLQKCEAGERIYKLVMRNPQGQITSVRTITGTWEQASAIAPGTYTAELTDLAGKVTTKTVVVTAAGGTLILP